MADNIYDEDKPDALGLPGGEAGMSDMLLPPRRDAGADVDVTGAPRAKPVPFEVFKNDAQSMTAFPASVADQPIGEGQKEPLLIDTVMEFEGPPVEAINTQPQLEKIFDIALNPADFQAEHGINDRRMQGSINTAFLRTVAGQGISGNPSDMGRQTALRVVGDRLFPGQGVKDEQTLHAAITGMATQQRDEKEMLQALQDYAQRTAMIGEAGALAIQGEFDTIKQMPGYRPERAAEYLRMQRQWEAEADAAIRPYKDTIDSIISSFEEAGRGEALDVQDITNYSQEEWDGLLNAIHVYASGMTEENREGFLSGMGKKIDRMIRGAAGGAAETLTGIGLRGAEYFRKRGVDLPKGAIDERFGDSATFDKYIGRISDLNRIFQGQYDPVDQKGFLGVVQSIPSVAAGSLLMTTSAPMLAGSMTGFSRDAIYQQSRNQGISEEQSAANANTWAIPVAAPMMAIERFQVRAVTGKVPGFNKWLVRVSDNFSNGVARAGARIATASAVEATTEVMQDMSDASVRELASMIQEEMPETAWTEEMVQAFKSFPEYAVSMLGLSGLAAVGGRHLDQAALALKEDYTHRERVIFGVPAEVSKKIDATDAADVGTLTELYKDGMERKDASSDEAQAELESARKEWEEAEAQRAASAKAGLALPEFRLGNDGKWAVTDRDTGEVLGEGMSLQQAKDTALESTMLKNDRKGHLTAQMFDMLEVTEATAAKDMETVLQPFFEANAETIQQYVENGEQVMLEQAQIMGMAEGSRVYGVSQAELKERGRNTVNRIFQGGNVLTVFHEEAHKLYRDAQRSGALTHEAVRDTILEIDSEMDSKLLPDGFDKMDDGQQRKAVDEALSELVEVEILRRRKTGTHGGRLDPGLISRAMSSQARMLSKGKSLRSVKGFVDTLKTFFGVQLARLAELKRGIKEGRIDEAKLDSLLDKLYGMDGQAEMEKQAEAETKEILDTPAVDAPFQLSPLSDAEASAMLEGATYISPEDARWDDIVGPVVIGAYHGSTHTIDKFTDDRANPENDFGEGIYATTSPEDASENYAGEGPDLTTRIESRSEQLAQKLEDQFEKRGRKEVLESLYRSLGDLTFVSSRVADMDDTDAAFEAAKVIAKQELVGEGGRIYPLYLPIKNPAVIEEGGGTFYDPNEDLEAEIEEHRKDAEQEIIDEYGIEESELEDYEGEIRDRQVELAGVENPVYEAAAETANLYGLDAGAFSEALDTMALEGAYLYQIEDALRSKEELGYAEAEDGGMIGPGEIIHTFLKKLGYDGIIDRRANSKFGSESKYKAMEGMDENTVHVILPIETENRPRSAFDPSASFQLGPAAMAEAVTDQVYKLAKKEPAAKQKIFENIRDRLLKLKQFIDERDHAYNFDAFGKRYEGEFTEEKTSMLNALAILQGLRAALPLEVRAKIGGDIQLVKYDTDQKRLDYLKNKVKSVEKHVDSWLNREYNIMLDQIFKREKPKAEAGKKAKGKAGPQVHALFQSLKEYRKKSQDDVDAHVAGIDAKLAAGVDSIEEETRMQMESALVALVGNWRDATLERKAQAVDAVRSAFEAGYYTFRLQKLMEQEDRQIAVDTLREQTGNKGDAPARKRKARKQTGLKGKWKDILVDLLSFDQVMELAFGKDSILGRKFVDTELKAAEQKEDFTQDRMDAVEELFTEMAGGKLAGEKLRYEMAQENGKMGMTVQGLPMSQFEAIQATMMWRQEDGRRHMEGKKDDDGKPLKDSWNYGESFVEEIESKLTDEAKQFRAFIANVYGNEWSEINPVYKKLEGIDLPQNKYYSPLTVKPQQSSGQETIDPLTGFSISQGSVTPGSLRTRGHAIAEPDFRDALQLFIGHSKQIGHWIAYAPLVKEFSPVIRKRELQNSVEGAYGQHTARTLRNWNDWFTTGGTRDAAAHLALNGMLGRMVGRTAGAILAGRISVLVIQSTQLMASMAQMPVHSFLGRFARLMVGQLGWKSAFKSKYIQRRLKQQPVMVQEAMKGLDAAKPNRVKWVVKRIGDMIGGMDALMTAGSYAIIHDYKMKEARGMGLSDAEAERYAEQETAAAVDQIAQPTRSGARSYMENVTTNPLYRMLWAFGSEGRQKLALGLFRTVSKDRTIGERARALAVTWMVGGMFATMIRAALRDLKDDDEDNDERIYDPKRLLLSSMTGPIQGIPFLGDIIERAIWSGSGEWRPDGNILTSIEDLPKAVMSVSEWDDKDASEITKDVESILMGMAPMNDTIAAAASLSHLARDLYEIGENIATDD